jgi:hypothetical protein
LLVFVVAVFALIFKQMPWDYVPSDAESGRADADGVGDVSDAGDAEDAGDADGAVDTTDGAAVTALTENAVNVPASPISQNRQ